MPFGPFYKQSPEDRFILRMAFACCVLIIAVAALSLGWTATVHGRHTAQQAAAASAQAARAADQAKQAAQAAALAATLAAKTATTCEAWRLIATLPITAQTSDTGLGLISAGRDAYDGLSCQALHGPLPAPDPKVAAWARAHQKGNR